MNGNSGDGGLATLRHVIFKTMMVYKNKIEVQQIPPNDRAAYFHLLSVHVQVVVTPSTRTYRIASGVNVNHETPNGLKGVDVYGGCLGENAETVDLDDGTDI